MLSEPPSPDGATGSPLGYMQVPGRGRRHGSKASRISRNSELSRSSRFSRVTSSDSANSATTASTDEEPESDVPADLDHLEALIQRQLYHRGNPFKKMTAAWLEGIDSRWGKHKEDEERMNIDAMREQLKDDMHLHDKSGGKRNSRLSRVLQGGVESPMAKAAAESARVRRLAAEAEGHLLWLRAREPRMELVPAKEVPRRGVGSPRAEAPRSASTPALPTAAPVFATHWFRAPASAAAQEAFGETCCWRRDFVEGALVAAARVPEMIMPCISVDAVRRTAQYSASARDDMQELIRGRILAVCSDGRRELWSPSFVQSLDILCRQAGSEVCLSEQELRRRSPEVRFPAARPVKEEVGPLLLPVPVERLGLPTSPPPAPKLPDRLPHRICHNEEEKWSGIFKPELPSPTYSLRVEQLSANELAARRAAGQVGREPLHQPIRGSPRPTLTEQALPIVEEDVPGIPHTSTLTDSSGDSLPFRGSPSREFLSMSMTPQSSYLSPQTNYRSTTRELTETRHRTPTGDFSEVSRPSYRSPTLSSKGSYRSLTRELPDNHRSTTRELVENKGVQNALVPEPLEMDRPHSQKSVKFASKRPSLYSS